MKNSLTQHCRITLVLFLAAGPAALLAGSCTRDRSAAEVAAIERKISLIDQAPDSTLYPPRPTTAQLAAIAAELDRDTALDSVLNLTDDPEQKGYSRQYAYSIVTSEGAEDLANKVNRYLAHGYYLRGPLLTRRCGPNRFLYVQNLVRQLD